MADLSIIAIYFTIILWVGFKTGRRTKGLKNFSIGSRNFSIPVLVAALSGTLIGGGGTFGLAEKVFSSGVIFLAAYCGIFIERTITAIFIADRIKPFFGSITAGDIMERLYGKIAKVVTGIATITTSIFILGAHITTMGFIFEVFLGVSLNLGLIISTLVIVTYSVYGGISSVSFTDVVQFGFMLVSIPLVAFIALVDVGGFSKLNFAVPKEHLNFFLLDRSKLSQHAIIFLSYSLPALYPVVIQRMLMAKNVRQIKLSLHFNTFLSAFYFVTIALIGLLSLAKNPSIDARQAFPFLINHSLPVGIKGFVIVGLLATVMSTVDSFINLIGVSFTNDIIRPIMRTQLSEDTSLKIARITMIFIGIAGLLSALYFNGILENVFASMNLWIPFIFPPLFMGIRLNKGSQKSFLTGTISAAITLIILRTLGGPQGFSATILAAFANAIALLACLDRTSTKTKISAKESLFSLRLKEYLRSIISGIESTAATSLKNCDTLGLFILLTTTLPMLVLAGTGQHASIIKLTLSTTVSLVAVFLILKDLWIDKWPYRSSPALLVTALVLSQITQPMANLYINNFSLVELINTTIGLLVIWIYFGPKHGSLLTVLGAGLCLAFVPFFETIPMIESDSHRIFGVILRLLFLLYIVIDFREKDKSALQNYLRLNGIMAHEIGHSVVAMNFCSKKLRDSLPILLKCYKTYGDRFEYINDKSIFALQNLTERLTKNADRTIDTLQIIQTEIEPKTAKTTIQADFSIRDAVLEAHDSVSFRKSVDFRISHEDFCVTANRGAVVHVFINIIKNAYQALKHTAKPIVTVSIEPESYSVKITDNGAGIPIDVHKQVFKEGFTTKTDGNGRGLSFCELVMKSIGGSIILDSSPHKTSFFINFPYDHKE